MRIGRSAATLAATVSLLLAGAGSATARPTGGPGHQGSRAVTKDTQPWFTDVTGSAVSVSGIYVPIVGQFDANSRDDILWYAPGTATDQLWSGQDSNGSTAPFVKHALAQQVNGTYVAIAGNFGGDSHTDVLWYAPGSAPDFLWISNGDGTFTSHSVSITGTYQDVVLHNALPAHDAILWMSSESGGSASLWQFTSSGSHTSYGETIPTGSHDQVAVTGDFDGNGFGDVFFYSPGTTGDTLWRRNGAAVGTFTKTPETVNGQYDPITEDFTPNADGRTDILWYDAAAGHASLWQGHSSGAFGKTDHAVPVGGNPVALHEEWGYVVTYGSASDDMIWFDNAPNPDYFAPDDNAKVDPNAEPVVGDFNLAGEPGVLWYRPGSAAEHLFIPSGL